MLFKKTLITSALVVLGLSFQADAKVPPEKAEAVKQLTKERGGKVMGQRTGKKVLKAFDLYNGAERGEDYKRTDAEELQDTKEAIALLLEINPSNTFDKATVDRYIGGMYAGMDGKGKDAIKFLKQAVDANVLPYGDHGEALRNLGALSTQEKNYKDAIKYNQAYLDFSMDEAPKVYLAIANAYYEMKQYDKVVAPANKSIEFFAKWDKPNINAYILLMAAYYERKMMPEATKAVEEIVRTFPTEGRWWIQLGGFYALTEQNDKALSTYRLANEQGFLEKDTHFKRLAQFYSNAGIPFKSAMVQEEQIKKGVIEKDERALSIMAQTFQNAKEFKKAAKYYGEAASMKNDADLYRKQGIALMAAENYRDAVKALDKSLKAEPKRKGPVLLAIGEAHFYLENWKKSHTAFVDAGKIKSSARTAKGWLGFVKETAKRKGVAL